MPVSLKSEAVDEGILGSIPEIRLVAHGILAVDVYAEIYRQAKIAPEGAFVEVGTAHGAATICMALGLRDRGGAAYRLYSFDRMEGGSRSAYGGVAENEEIARRNFERFGVADIVELLIGDVQQTAAAIADVPNIGMLMLDADGRIDRDLELFYDRLAPGAVVIIDDCDNLAVVNHINSREVMVDLKHRLACALAKLCFDEGYLVQAKMVDETIFAYKPADAGRLRPDFVAKTRDVYRDLVFTRAQFRHHRMPSLHEVIVSNPRWHNAARALKHLLKKGRLPRQAISVPQAPLRG